MLNCVSKGKGHRELENIVNEGCPTSLSYLVNLGRDVCVDVYGVV